MVCPRPGYYRSRRCCAGFIGGRRHRDGFGGVPRRRRLHERLRRPRELSERPAAPERSGSGASAANDFHERADDAIELRDERPIENEVTESVGDLEYREHLPRRTQSDMIASHTIAPL